MPTTTYTISGEGLETVTRTSKPSAIKVADELRGEHKVTVTVATAAGTVVYTAKARKPQRTTKPFTRVDARDFSELLGEGVSIPEGYEVAYGRPRGALVTLRTEGEDGFSYLVFDLASGKSADAATTREAGQIMKGVKKGELELAV